MKGITLVAIGLVALLAGATPDAGASEFDFGNPVFCAPTKPINDFGLSTLPPTHEAPVDGDLPFGPKTVSISVEAGPIIAIGGGVRFDIRSNNFNPHGRTPLEWVMRDRLRSLDATGSPGAVISQGKHRIRYINAAREDKLILDPPRTPGFYRYETEISDFDGKRLALYVYNLRVERKFWDVRLGLNRTAFYPGNHVLSRIENFGTLAPSYGEEFRLQRLAGGRWRTIDTPGRGGWLLWAGWVSAGMSGRCSSLALPRDFPAGQYRILKEWQRRLDRNAPPYYLTAPFEVRPCGSKSYPCPALPETRTPPWHVG